MQADRSCTQTSIGLRKGKQHASCSRGFAAHTMGAVVHATPPSHTFDYKLFLQPSPGVLCTAWLCTMHIAAEDGCRDDDQGMQRCFVILQSEKNAAQHAFAGSRPCLSLILG